MSYNEADTRFEIIKPKLFEASWACNQIKRFIQSWARLPHVSRPLPRPHSRRYYLDQSSIQTHQNHHRPHLSRTPNRENEKIGSIRIKTGSLMNYVVATLAALCLVPPRVGRTCPLFLWEKAGEGAPPQQSSENLKTLY